MCLVLGGYGVVGSAAGSALWSIGSTVGGGLSYLSSFISSPIVTAKTGENALRVIAEGNGVVKMIESGQDAKCKYEIGRLSEPGKKNIGSLLLGSFNVTIGHQNIILYQGNGILLLLESMEKKNQVQLILKKSRQHYCLKMEI